MIHGFGAAAIRAAERPLLDAGEPLMLRAAQALADRIRVHLTSNAQRPRPSSGSGPYADAVTGAPHADTAGTAAGSSDAPRPVGAACAAARRVRCQRRRRSARRRGPAT